MAITFVKNDKFILITAPQVTVTIQDLLNAIRDYEDEITTMDIPHLADASGKEDLGGGVQVGITMELLDGWRIKFEERCDVLDPSLNPEFIVQCAVTGGNVVTTNDYDNNPIAPSGCTQVTITSSSSATIATLEIANLQQLIEMQRPTHAGVGDIWYWDPFNGNDTNNGESKETATATFAQAQTLAATHNGDVIVAVPGDPAGLTTTSEVITFTKAFILLRGPGRDFNIQSNDMTQPSITIASGADMCEVSSIRIAGEYVAHPNPSDWEDKPEFVPGHGYLKDHVGICIEANNALIKDIWISNVHADGVRISNSEYSVLDNVHCDDNGSHGIHLHENLNNITLKNCQVDNNAWDGIHIDGNNVDEISIVGEGTITHSNGWYGVRISTGAEHTLIDRQITTDADDLGTVLDEGINTHYTGQDINEAYLGHVTLDIVNGGRSGTKYPRGTTADPVDNLTDALTIMSDNGFHRLVITGNITADATHNLDNLTVEAGSINSGITLSGCSTSQTKFEGIGMKGTLDGRVSLDGCAIATVSGTELFGFHGQMERCYLLGPVTILADIFGSAITDCFSYSTFVLDMDGQDTTVDFRNQAGNTRIRNLTTDSNMSISFDAGTLTVENSCTAGAITVEGVARVWDSSTGTCEVIQVSTVSKAHTDLIERKIELTSKKHIAFGPTYYWDPYSGDDGLDGRSATTAVSTFARAHSLITSGIGTTIIALAKDPSGRTTAYENIVISKDDVMIKSSGREFILRPTSPNEPTVKFTGEGSQLQSMQVYGHNEYGFQSNIEIWGEHISIDTVWVNHSRMHGVYLRDTKYSEIKDCVIEHGGQYFNDFLFEDPSAANPSDIANPSDVPSEACGIFFGYNTKENLVQNCEIWDTQGDGICLDNEGGYCTANYIKDCRIFDNAGWGINITVNTTDTLLDTGNTVADNDLGNINDLGEETYYSGIDNVYHYDGHVDIDIGEGITGIFYPRGTNGHAVNNIVEAKIIAESHNIKKFRLVGDIVLEEDFDGYTFIAHAPDVASIDLNGKDISNCSFESITITGSGVGHFHAERCHILSGYTDIDCQLVECIIGGTFVIASGLTMDGIRCYTRAGVVCTFNLNGDGSVNMANFEGIGMAINMTDAASGFNITGHFSAIMHSSCVAGEAQFAGIGTIVDMGATTTITSAVLPSDTWEEVMASHLTVGTVGEALSNAGAGGDVNQIAAAVWDRIANISASVPGSYGDALLNVEVDATIIENAVWDADLTAHTVADSAGAKLETASAGGVIDNDAIATAVWDKIANPSDIIANSYGDELVNGTTNVNAEEIADAVWNEDLTTHTDADSAGAKLETASDIASMVDDVWEELASDHTSGTTMGGKLNAASAGGIDYDSLADAVWEEIINVSDQVPGSYGAEISEISASMGTISDDALYSLSTTVDAPIAGFLTTKFTMTDGRTADDAYENCIIALQDQITGFIEMRRISAYVGATKQVTVDRAFSFNVANGDVVSISKLSYGGATATGGGGSGPRLGD